MPKHAYHFTQIHGAPGQGRTITDAKQDAVARITRAFAGCDTVGAAALAYDPLLLRFPHGEVGLVFRDLDGWHEQTAWLDRERTTRSCYGPAYASARDAERALRRDIAQSYWNDAASAYGAGLLLPDDAEGHRQHQRYLAFQRAAQTALRAGLDHNAAHQYGCEQMAHPECWTTPLNAA